MVLDVAHLPWQHHTLLQSKNCGNHAFMNSDWPCPPNNAHSPCTCCKTKWQKHWPVLLRKKPNGPSTRGCSKDMERCGTHSDCSRTWANAGRNLCQTWTGGGIAAHSKQCEFTKDSKKYIELAATITYHYHYTVYTSVSINIFQKIQALAARCFFSTGVSVTLRFELWHSQVV